MVDADGVQRQRGGGAHGDDTRQPAHAFEQLLEEADLPSVLGIALFGEEDARGEQPFGPKAGLFVEDSAALGARWRLSGGVRVDYTTYSGDYFSIDVPEEWEDEVDGDTWEGELRVRFIHPNDDYQIVVEYWVNDELLSASADARWSDQTFRDDLEDGASDYERIEIRREDPDDHPEDWDVAYFEYTVTHETWTTEERRVATRHVSVGGEENYRIILNTPAESFTDYTLVRDHVFDSFLPR